MKNALNKKPSLASVLLKYLFLMEDTVTMRWFVVAKPNRSILMALRYSFPKRLTISKSVNTLDDKMRHIYAWLWWNI